MALTSREWSSPPVPIQIAVDASRCLVRIGDRVIPETVLGVGPETGEILAAGCHGEVVAMRFIGGERAFIVVIRPADT